MKAEGGDLVGALELNMDGEILKPGESLAEDAIVASPGAEAEGVEVLDHRVERGESGGERESLDPGEKGPVGAEREGEAVI